MIPSDAEKRDEGGSIRSVNPLRSRVTFDSNGLSIEGILHTIDTTDSTPGVVVCHPHPLYGGTMHSDVVISVCEQLNVRGITALRFNFRGVGRSQGRYDEGEGELDDALAAVSFLTTLPNVNPARIGIAGYSFGAYVALRAAVADERIGAVAAISPPVGLYDLTFFHDYRLPKMLISGAEDDLVSPRDFLAFAEKALEPKVYEVARYADHFWGGLEPWVGSKVADFFADIFGAGT